MTNVTVPGAMYRETNRSPNHLFTHCLPFDRLCRPKEYNMVKILMRTENYANEVNQLVSTNTSIEDLIMGCDGLLLTQIS